MNSPSTIEARSDLSQPSFPPQSNIWLGFRLSDEIVRHGADVPARAQGPSLLVRCGQDSVVLGPMLLTTLILKRGCRRCPYRLNLIYPFSPCKDMVVFLVNFLQFKLEQRIQDIGAELLVTRTELSIMSNIQDDLQNERKSEWSRKPEEWSFKQLFSE